MRDRATIKKVLRFIRPHGGLVALMLLLAAVTVASTLYAPILIGKAVDQIVGPGQIYVLKLSRILVQLGVVIAVTAVAQWLMNLLTNQVTYRVVQDVRAQAFLHLQKVPVSYIDQNRKRCESVFRRIVNGIYTTFYRHCDDLRYDRIYAFHKRKNCVVSGFVDPGFSFCGQLYCQSNVSDVPSSIGEAGRDDFPCGRVSGKSESGSGILL